MSEVWKDVVGYEGLYKVSNLGNVLSVRAGRNLTPQVTHAKYIKVFLSKGGKCKNVFCHRLVAEAFIGPIYDQVDHIDGDKQNNKLENLRLCTRRENRAFAQKNDYFGSYYDRTWKRWKACISINNANVDLGVFKNQEEAHQAYLAALERYGIPPLRHWKDAK